MGYKNMETGKNLSEKPEYMASLFNDELVYKNHPRMILRGYLDALKAKLLVYMHELMQSKKNVILQDVAEVFHWVKVLQRCEVTGEIVERLTFNSMDYSAIRKVSHNPKQYFGVGHLFDLHYQDHIDVLKINEMKAFVRQMEIAAFNAYFINGKIEREDFLTAANRLSSVLYIVELKILAGDAK